MESNHISVTATIRFEFATDDDAIPPDTMIEIEDRIRCAKPIHESFEGVIQNHAVRILRIVWAHYTMIEVICHYLEAEL